MGIIGKINKVILESLKSWTEKKIQKLEPKKELPQQAVVKKELKKEQTPESKEPVFSQHTPSGQEEKSRTDEKPETLVKPDSPGKKKELVLEDGIKRVPGFSHYSVMRSGKVYSHRRGVIMKGSSPECGFNYVKITGDDGDRVGARVDSLVAEAFVEKKDGFCYVRHLDGDRMNDRAENLAWVRKREKFEKEVPKRVRRHPDPVREEVEDHVKNAADRMKIEGSSRFQVTSMGEIVNRKTGGVVKKNLSKYGFEYVGLIMDDGRRKNFPVHDLVAKTFVERGEGCEFVHHLDENRSNNMASNLKWDESRQYLPKYSCARHPRREQKEWMKDSRITSFPGIDVMGTGECQNEKW